MKIKRIAANVKSIPVDVLLQRGLGVAGSNGELTNDLLNLRTRIANFGRGQLNEELKRQGVL